MPLPSSAVQRRHIHTRRIVCEAFEREDGLWDVEANMSDVKTYDSERAQAGEAVHDMWIRLTLDTKFVIHAVESAMDSYPRVECPHAVNPMKELVGVRIGAGWQTEVRKRIGGALGCTHLRELLAPMATTAMQAMGGVLRGRGAGHPKQGRGTCFAKSDDADRAHYRETFGARATEQGTATT
jgi:hypothetical protein